MQALARDNLSAAEVLAILTAPVRDASVYGAEVLNLDGTPNGDLSGTAPGKRSPGIVGGGGDLTGLVITHDATQPTPTDIKLTCTRELEWGSVRVRPWQEINGIRFYGGLYGLETPTQSPADGEFTVQGYDMLSPLRVPIHDTRVIPIGTSYLTAARDWLDELGIPGLVHQIASDANDVLVADTPLVFALSTNNTDLVLDCINDLLRAVGYAPLSMDETGRIVSAPYRDPAERPSEWTFDLRGEQELRADGKPRLSIVDVERSKKIEGFQKINWWRFVRRGMGSAPVEGAGWYTPVPKPDGYVNAWQETVDVTSQDALKAYGDARVVADTTQVVTLELDSEAMPHLGLGVPDVATVIDPETGINGRVQIPKWTQDYGQANVSMTLGVL